MKVLIVAKTHMRQGACVGGLVVGENRNLRLYPALGSNAPPDTLFQVGEIWDLQCRRKQFVVAPHVEDVEVVAGSRLGTQDKLAEFLLAHTHPWHGGPECLFDGLLNFTCHGAGFIRRDGTLPQGSVGFWRPASDLRAEQRDGKTRYRCPDRDGTALIPYVGYEPALGILPRGSLLRVSLARWWQPADAPDIDERCYLQLSGWYQPIGSGAEPPAVRESSPTPVKAYSIAAIRAAHNQAYAPWSAQDDEYLEERFLEGASIDDLVSEFGRQPGGIRARLRKLGFDSARGAGPATPKPEAMAGPAEPESAASTWREQRPHAGRAWTPDEDQALLRGVGAGLPLEAIATVLGRGVFGLEVRLHKLGHCSHVPKPMG